MPAATKTKTQPAKTAARKPAAAPSKNEIVWDPDGKVRSAKGTAKFAYLTRPDDKFGAPVHKITVYFDAKDPEFKAMAARILKFENAYLKDLKKPAVKTPSCLKTDDDGPYICFKCAAREDGTGGYEPVPVYNAAKEITKIAVWSGDTVRVIFNLGGWSSAFGAGAKPYLKAVQVLVSTKGSSDAGELFDVEEDFLTDAAADLEDEGEDTSDLEDALDGDGQEDLL